MEVLQQQLEVLKRAYALAGEPEDEEEEDDDDDDEAEEDGEESLSPDVRVSAKSVYVLLVPSADHYLF